MRTQRQRQWLCHTNKSIVHYFEFLWASFILCLQLTRWPFDVRWVWIFRREKLRVFRTCTINSGGYKRLCSANIMADESERPLWNNDGFIYFAICSRIPMIYLLMMNFSTSQFERRLLSAHKYTVRSKKTQIFRKTCEPIALCGFFCCVELKFK